MSTRRWLATRPSGGVDHAKFLEGDPVTPRRRWITRIVLGLCIAVACVPGCVVKDDAYTALVERYRTAAPLCDFSSTEGARNDRSSNRRLKDGTTAKIMVGASNGDVLIQYSDEAGPRRVSARRDYSRVQEIRVTDRALYAQVSYTLLWTEDWLFEYDLGARRLLADRRTARADIERPGSKPCAQ
jgi:hypothetical protein